VFYGTVGALIFVTFLAAMPLGVQMMKVHMLQIGMDIEEAGRVVGGSWFRTYCNVIVPILVPALAVVGIIVFASTIRNVSTIMLLSSGDSKVLSVLQVEFLSVGSLGPAAVVGTIIMLISVAAALLVRLISLRFGVHAR
jgi:iron(III) transport system permease protein